MTDRPIRVILDTSAVLRFVRSGEPSTGVGETIAEIRDEDAGFGVPVSCLAEADLAWQLSIDKADRTVLQSRRLCRHTTRHCGAP